MNTINSAVRHLVVTPSVFSDVACLNIVDWLWTLFLRDCLVDVYVHHVRQFHFREIRLWMLSKPNLDARKMYASIPWTWVMKITWKTTLKNTQCTTRLRTTKQQEKPKGWYSRDKVNIIGSLYTGSPFSVLYHNRSMRQNTVLFVQ